MRMGIRRGIWLCVRRRRHWTARCGARTGARAGGGGVFAVLGGHQRGGEHSPAGADSAGVGGDDIGDGAADAVDDEFRRRQCDGERELSDAISRADKYLYEAKRAGRNRVFWEKGAGGAEGRSKNFARAAALRRRASGNRRSASALINEDAGASRLRRVSPRSGNARSRRIPAFGAWERQKIKNWLDSARRVL